MIVEGKTDGWLRLPIDTLPAWASFNHVRFDGIKIGPQSGREDRGSTVVSRRQLNGGHEAPLMIVPKDLILSLDRVQEHAKSDADFRIVLDGLGEFGRTARGAILSFLLMQAFTACPLVDSKKGVSSPFTEYIKFLPTELLPTFWNESELELLKGTTLAPAIAAKLNSLHREFEKLQLATTNIPWCAEAWWHETDGLLTFDDWLQVDAMYRSRALEFPGVGDCMVPCIDMANHSSGESTAAIYEVDADGNALLLLREGKQISAEEEITITYGDKKGACEMIFSYGFVEDDMSSAQELFLDLAMPSDDPLGRAKTAVADCAPGFKIFETENGIDWEGEFIWLVCVNEEDGLDFAVQQTVEGARELRAFWQGQEMASFKNFRSLLEDDRMWDIYKLRAIAILQDRVATQLQTLYGSDEQVNAMEPGNVGIRSRPWEVARRLRALEADLLEKAYEDFEDQKTKLGQSDVVLAYLAAVSSSDQANDDTEDFS